MIPRAMRRLDRFFGALVTPRPGTTRWATIEWRCQHRWHTQEGALECAETALRELATGQRPHGKEQGGRL